MLTTPRLDDLSYDTLFERARALIPTITNEWTDLNQHDPGITTLQTFAWLYDMLNYYMNATGEVHRLKYLKLLGLFTSEQAARCLMTLPELKEDLLLQAGTVFSAGSTSFETEKTAHIHPNKLLHLYNHVDEQIYDLTAFVQDSDGAEIFTLNPHTRAALYLCFEKEFSGRFSFYSIVVKNSRNPFCDSFTLSTCEWECYNGTSWEAVTVIKDETCGFLKNGLIELETESPSARMENSLFAAGYYLRCRITHNEHDILPRLMRIEPNYVWVNQVKTYAFCECIEAGDRVNIDRYVDEGMLLSVAVKQNDSYVEAYLYNEGEHDLVSVVKTDTMNEIVFDKGSPPAQMLVFGIMQEFVGEAMLGTTDGTANQSFQLIFPDIIEIEVALVSETADGRYVFDLWRSCEDITTAGYEDRVFRYNPDEGVLCFGDSIHGAVPEAGQEVMIIHLKTSLKDNGNVLAGQIDRLESNSKLYVTNPQPAFGGTRRQSSTELCGLIEQRINRVTRAVTESDYIKIVKSTPGLLISGVSVITMEDYSSFYKTQYRPNTVVLAVKPLSSEPHPILNESYRKIILDHLWKYRLMTTDIEVVSCTYVGVNVNGRISLYDNNEKSRQSVCDCIREFADKADTVEFGTSVDFGRLFSALEMTQAVRGISELSLEYIGTGGCKNEQGDIVIFKDSLSYLRDIRIEFS